MALRKPAPREPGSDIQPVTRDTSQPPATRQSAQDGQVAIPAEMLDRIEAAVAAIPDGDDADAFGIYEALLEAETESALNAPWEGTSGRDLAGKRIRIESITRKPSAFEGGPTIFLLIKGTDVGTGERVVVTSSSIAVILQAASLWNHDWLPAVADIVVSDRPTKRGFLPYHLNVVKIRDGR